MAPMFLVVEVKKECTVEELIKEHGRNPEVYYAIKDERVLLPKEKLYPGERVAIVPLIAGGR